MIAADKIASLEARREDAYNEAMRLGGLPDEQFGPGEELAYNALLERIAGINEYLAFLENGCREVKKPARPPRTFNRCLTCDGDSYDGQLCRDCLKIWLEMEKQR